MDVALVFTLLHSARSSWNINGLDRVDDVRLGWNSPVAVSTLYCDMRNKNKSKSKKKK